MGYLNDTIRGISWTGGLRASYRGLVFVKLAILARLLTPQQFGVFGIATLVLALLEVVSETGVNVFLIQEKAKLEKYLDTAWAVSICRGVLISTILLILSSFISSFFNSPESLKLLLLISLVPLIRGFVNPSIVKFQKDLNFSKEFLFRFSIYFIDAFTAVVIAVKTHSPASLVIGMIVAALFEVVFSHIFVSPRPKIKFELIKLKQVLNRGKWITLSGFFNYLFENVDDGVVGRLLNPVSLGFYQMACKISSMPLTEVVDMIKKVTFPIYVKISFDKNRLRKAFIKTMIVTMILVFPLGVILFLFPGPIVKIILGEKWLAIVPTVKVMSFFGVVRALTISAYPLFFALKKQSYVSVVNFAGVVVLGLCVVPLVIKFGIVGAGISALAGTIATIPVVVFYLYRIFK